MNTSLFPQVMPIEVYGKREGNDKCPHCGEQRVTDCIHGHLTFLCGASGHFGKAITPCEEQRWERFVECAHV